MAEIDGYNTLIEKSDVEARIEELEGERGYVVVRLRNDEVLARFSDEDEARQYIEDEDYNPDRVTVREGELDSDDEQELGSLRTLIDDVAVDADWTLYSADYFDADWARERATEALGLRYGSSKFDEWPLDQIDWDDAAASERDALYPYQYRFDGTYFYGEE